MFLIFFNNAETYSKSIYFSSKSWGKFSSYHKTPLQLFVKRKKQTNISTEPFKQNRTEHKEQNHLPIFCPGSERCNL